MFNYQPKFIHYSFLKFIPRCCFFFFTSKLFLTRQSRLCGHWRKGIIISSQTTWFYWGKLNPSRVKHFLSFFSFLSSHHHINLLIQTLTWVRLKLLVTDLSRPRRWSLPSLWVAASEGRFAKYSLTQSGWCVGFILLFLSKTNKSEIIAVVRLWANIWRYISFSKINLLFI